ncbi:alpha/beta fold hydrolase [Actinomycetospora termitidis]|uniref:Alpha/beta hydrolase n=1 Tax=Actinomycetospora termitidis TaxID=3053470 RepID=A0ABT7M6E1_9PSEU|nr:alpha/beta hydrolase [Actinomycetospora sp. Odt1-22]MDL5156226.1 alpha/beta hydrolase [Actinomycetospora sp. Odt1-22]
MSVSDHGDGPPVLLLHGTAPGTTAEGNFSALRPELAGFRTVAPDLLGFGASAKPLDLPYGPELWARQAWHLLDERGIDRVVVIGNSMGARVALTMASTTPSRIRGLVLLSTRVLPSRTSAQTLMRRYTPDLAAMERLVRECFVTDPAVVTADLIRRRFEASAAPGAHEAMQAVFAGLAADTGLSEDDLARVATPALVLHGRGDRVVPAENAVRLAELLPHADVHLLAGTGHWLQIERAALVGALIRDFLDRCPA